MATSEISDLILMNLRLPVMDGITALKKIQSFYEIKIIPVIALTAIVIEGEAEKALEIGFKDSITKPFEVKFFYY